MTKRILSMKEYLIDDWPRVLRVSYSSWFQLAGIALLIAPEALFYFAGVDLNPRVLWLGALALLISGWAGRFIKQENAGALFRRLLIVALLVAFGMWAGPSLAMGQVGDDRPALSVPDAGSEWPTVRPIMLPLVVKWEGKHPCPDAPELHCSYFDRIASPPLWTVCYGHTATAREGQRFTEAQCLAQLGRDIRQYWQGWRDAVTVTVPAGAQAAFGSLTYNIGIGAARGSTATRRLNAGNPAGACEAMGWWNKAGGRTVRGLVNRRSEEVALCRSAHGLA